MNGEQFLSALRQLAEGLIAWLSRVDLSNLKLADERPVEARTGHQGFGMYRGEERIDPYDPSDPQDME